MVNMMGWFINIVPVQSVHLNVTVCSDVFFVRNNVGVTEMFF